MKENCQSDYLANLRKEKKPRNFVSLSSHLCLEPQRKKKEKTTLLIVTKVVDHAREGLTDESQCFRMQ